MAPEVYDQRGAEAAASTGGAGQSTHSVVAVLWTRRSLGGTRARVVDRLETLRTAGTVSDFETRTWPETVVHSEHTERPDVVEAFEAFEAWADDRGVRITPPFERRTVTSQLGRTCEVLTLPRLCLAVYDGDDLRGVFPFHDGERTWTVTGFLEAVATDETDPVAVVADLLAKVS